MGRDSYSAAEIRAAEASLIAKGVPLMARAAAGLARVIRESIAGIDAPRVLLLVGSGDNGGDALFAGAELASESTSVTVLRTGDRVHGTGLSAALAAGAEVADVPSAMPHVIVDGILGTGTSASPALRGRVREIVVALLPVVRMPGGPIVIAVDLPSGIDPDTGATEDGVVLPAYVTVTFGAVKTGLRRPPGSDLAGEVRFVDIGLGAELDRLFP